MYWAREPREQELKSRRPSGVAVRPVMAPWWHVCSTRTSAASRLKERTAPLLKPQKKIGLVGWKVTVHGASSDDVKSYSCCRVARSQMRTVRSWDTVASCPRLCSVARASTGAVWERASMWYTRDGVSRKPRWPEEVADSTRRPSGLTQTELTGPSCSVGGAGSGTSQGHPRVSGMPEPTLGSHCSGFRFPRPQQMHSLLLRVPGSTWLQDAAPLRPPLRG